MKHTPCFRGAFVTVLIAIAMSGCDQGAEPPSKNKIEHQVTTPTATVKRVQDKQQIARGAQIYRQNCAGCHGVTAEGATKWNLRDADGKFPPPPLNGTAHTWHHPKKILRYVIKNGSPGGQGNMPAWKDQLTDGQIDDVIAWFQSLWSDEVYAAWVKIDQRNR